MALFRPGPGPVPGDCRAGPGTAGPGTRSPALAAPEPDWTWARAHVVCAFARILNIFLINEHTHSFFSALAPPCFSALAPPCLFSPGPTHFFQPWPPIVLLPPGPGRPFQFYQLPCTDSCHPIKYIKYSNTSPQCSSSYPTPAHSDHSGLGCTGSITIPVMGSICQGIPTYVRSLVPVYE